MDGTYNITIDAYDLANNNNKTKLYNIIHNQHNIIFQNLISLMFHTLTIHWNSLVIFLKVYIKTIYTR